jgi:GTP-binding protein Era
LKGSGIAELLQTLEGYLEPGPEYFPQDMMTDVPERFIAAELIREKCYQRLRDEVPYGIAVVVETWEEDEKGKVTIDAVIWVERNSQKGIVIGKKGHMLKEIGTRAREDLERLLGTRVRLNLWVKVNSDWSHNPRILRELGYTE